VLSGEAAHSLCFDPIGLEPTIYQTRGGHAKHYITDAVQMSPISQNRFITD